MSVTTLQEGLIVSCNRSTVDYLVVPAAQTELSTHADTGRAVLFTNAVLRENNR